jgi:hypothetical protein
VPTSIGQISAVSAWRVIASVREQIGSVSVRAQARLRICPAGCMAGGAVVVAAATPPQQQETVAEPEFFQNHAII